MKLHCLYTVLHFTYHATVQPIRMQQSRRIFIGIPRDPPITHRIDCLGYIFSMARCKIVMPANTMEYPLSFLQAGQKYVAQH